MELKLNQKDVEKFLLDHYSYIGVNSIELDGIIYGVTLSVNHPENDIVTVSVSTVPSDGIPF